MEVRGINFAGGEPLITDAHYQILSRLIELGISDKISLTYTTNLSVLNYKQYNIVELWQHFQAVNLVFSLDGFGRAVEYSREGFKEQKFISNFETIKNFKNVSLNSHCVASIFSILSIPDYVKFCQNNEVNFSITCINWPPYYSTKILSQELKQTIRELYSHKTKEIDFDFNFILNDMDARIEKVLLQRKIFKHKTEQLDRIRNKQFIDYFPLFAQWYNSCL